MSKRVALAALGLLLAASGIAAAGAQVRRTEAAALGVAKRQAEEASARAARLENAASAASEAAERARAEASAMAARIEAAEADISAAEARVRIVEGLRRAQRARLAERQQPVVRLTAALQTMARRPPALALIQPGSVQDIVRVRALLAATLPVIRARTNALRAEVATGDRLRRQAELAVAELERSRVALRQRRVELARLEGERRRQSARLGASALVAVDQALVLGEEARELAELAGTREFREQVRRRLAALPAPMPRPGPPPANPPGGQYRLPVEGRLIEGVGEISDAGVHARGLTFATEPGSEVVAPRGGRVVYAAPFRDYGAVVIIDHGGGWTSALTRMADLAVRPGQTVRTGQTIGRAASDEPRVGVELRRGGDPVAITPLLGMRNSPAR